MYLPSGDQVGLESALVELLSVRLSSVVPEADQISPPRRVKTSEPVMSARSSDGGTTRIGSAVVSGSGVSSTGSSVGSGSAPGSSVGSDPSVAGALVLRGAADSSAAGDATGASVASAAAVSMLASRKLTMPTLAPATSSSARKARTGAMMGDERRGSRGGMGSWPGGYGGGR